MGIPSYFSHILRTYPNVLSTWSQFHSDTPSTTHLYMDCNSILYDVYHQLPPTLDNTHFDEVENYLLENTVKHIQDIIRDIHPSTVVYIAFDGVAPLAKMEQQRIRRHKAFLCSPFFLPQSDKPSKWGTHQITPGTPFMEKLQRYMTKAFRQSTQEGLHYVLSCGNRAGEGEHKMFDHLRHHVSFETSRICVYGLDADLLMLALFHLTYCPRIVVFRETPTFQCKQTHDPDNPFLFIDMAQLAHSIEKEMNCHSTSSARVHDYVFLCFFLGNDFLPHFPSLNIRTQGIQIIMDTYRRCLGNHPEKYVLKVSSTNGKHEIQWRWVRALVSELAKNESFFLQQEMKRRDKNWGNGKVLPNQTQEQTFENIPVLFRAKEKYIGCPEFGWQYRYYDTLFPSGVDPATVANEYLKGLQWVTQYYQGSCSHWRWHYPFFYPPLWQDLAQALRQIPTFDPDPLAMIPFHPRTQLAYVLPLKLLHETILSKELCRHREQYPHLYLAKVELNDMTWCFCRYLWESHLHCPVIPVPLLNQWDLGNVGGSSTTSA